MLQILLVSTGDNAQSQAVPTPLHDSFELQNVYSLFHSQVSSTLNSLISQGANINSFSQFGWPQECQIYHSR